MRTRYLYLLRAILAISDVLILNGAYFLSFKLVDYFIYPLDPNLYLQFALTYNLLWLLSAGIFGLHLENTIRKLELIYRGTLRAMLAHLLLVSVMLIFVKSEIYSRPFLFILFTLITVGLMASRFLITIFDIKYRRGIKKKKLVAVLGFNPTGIKLANYFKKNSADYHFHGILDETDPLSLESKEQLHNQLRDGLIKASSRNIQEVFAAVPPAMMASSRHLLTEAETLCVRLKLVPDLSSAMASRFNVQYMEEFPVLSLRTEPLEDLNNRFKKRIFDLLFSVMVIVFILSWLYPIIALIIKWQSPGPVLFKQLRSGRDNKPFTCYKFRSMKVNNDSDKKQASKDDDRITKIGRFLRKSSLDELPQFFNVLKGEMSVIGPRPHMLSHTEQYRAIIDEFMVRHYLKPGITGWAQVTGFRGETKDPSLMTKRVEKDIYYLENWSLMFDIRIVILTVFITVKGDEKAF